MFVAETAAKSGGWSVSAALGAGISLHHVSADGDRAAMFCAQALEVKSLSVVYRGSVTGDPDQALMAWMVGSSVSSFAGSVAARDRVMTSMPR